MKEKWTAWIGRQDGKTDWFGRLFPLLLGLGVIFLLLSNTHISKKQTSTQPNTQKEEQAERSGNTYTEELTRQLEEALSHMDGVGRVRVLLTLDDAGEAQVLQDLDYVLSEQEETEASGVSRKIREEQRQTQTVRDAQDQPYVLRESAPRVRGVLILAEGAQSSVVRQELLMAVQALLDVSADEVYIASYQ